MIQNARAWSDRLLSVHGRVRESGKLQVHLVAAGITQTYTVAIPENGFHVQITVHDTDQNHNLPTPASGKVIYLRPRGQAEVPADYYTRSEVVTQNPPQDNTVLGSVFTWVSNNIQYAQKLFLAGAKIYLNLAKGFIGQVFPQLLELGEMIEKMANDVGQFLQAFISKTNVFLQSVREAGTKGLNDYFDAVSTKPAEPLFGWLSQKVGPDFNVTPEDLPSFTTESVSGFVLKMLGLGWEDLQGEMVEKLGVDNVSMLDDAYESIEKWLHTPAGIFNAINDLVVQANERMKADQLYGEALNIGTIYLQHQLISKVPERIVRATDPFSTFFAHDANLDGARKGGTSMPEKATTDPKLFPDLARCRSYLPDIARLKLPGLPNVQREPGELRYLHGAKVEQIAAQLGMTADAVVGLPKRGLGGALKKRPQNDREERAMADKLSLTEVIEIYLKAVDNGEAPDRDALLAAHPHLADNGLRDFLDNETGLLRDVALPRQDVMLDSLPVTTEGLGASDARSDARAPAGYAIECVLGHGGEGVVYLARHLGLNRPCAVKMILAGAHADESDRRRFKKEAQAVAQLRHPGIVQVFEIGEHAGSPFMALELCPGGSLDAFLRKNLLSALEAAVLVRAVAEAVQAAHEAGVIHRDLKPANILLADPPGGPRQGTSRAGTRLSPKVTDFGLAKKLDELGPTRTGVIVGTPSYMAPEQAQGKKDVGPAADVYALGAILYECLTGKPPFKAATSVETLLQVIHEEPVPVREQNPSVDRGLAFICERCLSKDPASRYRSAQALAEVLTRWLDNEPVMPGFLAWVWQQFQAPCRIDQPGEWARGCFVLAGWRLVGHAVVALLLLANAGPAAYWAWFVSLHVGVWLLVWRVRSDRRLDATERGVLLNERYPIGQPRRYRRLDATERGVLLNWAATIAADALLLGLFCPLWGEARPEEVVRVYPAWLAVHGLWYVMEARRFWGRCYAVGFGLLLAGPVLPLFGLWAPPAYGLLNAALLVWLGDGLRRLAIQREETRTAIRAE